MNQPVKLADSGKSPLYVWGLLILLVFTAYSPALRGSFVWDDEAHILQDSASLPQIWRPGNSPQYYPLVYSSFYFEREYLWGKNTAGYHFINIVLQILNSVLIWRILRFLAIPGAGFAAVLFAIHPVNVETVAWMSERKNLMAGFFYFSALAVYLKFALRENAMRWKEWLLALSLYLLALLCKTVTCVFPAAALTLLWAKKKKISWREILPAVPFFFIGLVMGVLTISLEQERVGAKGGIWIASLLERSLIAGRAVIFYLQKIIWPHPLIFNYPRWTINTVDWQQYLHASLVIALILVLIIFRKKTGRWPLAAMLFYLINLFPALGFFNVYPMQFSYVADHFQYFACIAPIAVIAAAAQKIHHRRNRVILMGFILFFSFILSWKQSHIYLDPKTIWMDTIKKNPKSYLGFTNYGAELLFEGKDAEAEKYYQEALRLRPNYDIAAFALGLIAERRKDNKNATEFYRQAVDMNPENPDAQSSYAQMMALQGNREAAIEHYLKAVDIRPTFELAHTNLGTLFLLEENMEKAVEHFERSISLAPDIAESHNGLGIAYSALGERDQAIEHFKRAIEIRPNLEEALYNLDLELKRKHGNAAAVSENLPKNTII